MPAARAAASRLIPSKALASANRRLLTRPSRSRRASARSSAGVRLVAIGTATMAQAPGLLSLPGQLAGRRPRSRLPVAGISRDAEARGERLERGVVRALAEDEQTSRAAGPQDGEGAQQRGKVLLRRQAIRSEDHWRARVGEPRVAGRLSGAGGEVG